MAVFRNLLVSAAAGSGKTAVLVERIIRKITDPQHPFDIDRLLIVTFTNAAAAEMRERIGLAIEQALERQPENSHLQKQQTLLHNAQITTIHSFQLPVIPSRRGRIKPADAVVGTVITAGTVSQLLQRAGLIGLTPEKKEIRFT